MHFRHFSAKIQLKNLKHFDWGVRAPWLRPSDKVDFLIYAASLNYCAIELMTRWLFDLWCYSEFIFTEVI